MEEMKSTMNVVKADMERQNTEVSNLRTDLDENWKQFNLLKLKAIKEDLTSEDKENIKKLEGEIMKLEKEWKLSIGEWREIYTKQLIHIQQYYGIIE